jgi:hypothetical protein
MDNFSPNPVDNRILAEIEDEDQFNNSGESVGMRKKMLLSANISALTVHAYQENEEEYYEYEILGNSEIYNNGKVLLVFGDFQISKPPLFPPN